MLGECPVPVSPPQYCHGRYGRRVDAAQWRQYIGAYHDAHPGITETVLDQARHPLLMTPHRWLAAAVPPTAQFVVDVACGSAPLRVHLPHHRYLGVDSSEAELNRAVAAGRHSVVRADALHLPVQTHAADALTVSMALMLLSVPDALDEFARVLRPGGTLALMLPAIWPVHIKDLPAVLVLSAALVGPGSMPQNLGRRRLSKSLEASGFTSARFTQERFELCVRTPADARLAVESLYTPRRRPWQRRLAMTGLCRLPGHPTLPVPLLRVVAVRR